MSDAWETLAAVSTSGDAWERLNDITGGDGGTITHAYEAGIFSIIEAGGDFTAGADPVTFATTASESITFATDTSEITFIESDILEVSHD